VSRLREMVSRILAVLGWRDRELDAELRSHVEMATEENRRRGMPEEEARRQALRSFGGVTQVRERFREHEGLPLVENLRRDVLYALRQMRKSPGFAVVVIVMLALGIGATTAIFTVVYSTLVRSLPYPGADRIVAIHDTRIEGRSTGGLMSGPRFFDIQERSRSFESLAFFFFDAATLIEGRQMPVSVKAAGANAGIWEVLGTAPMLGRTFHAADDMPHAPETAVLSYAAWQKIFGADRGVIGRAVTLDGRTATVVGVMPKDFSGPGGVDLWYAAQWIPGNWGNYRGEGLRFINVFGRLRSGVSLDQARSDLARVGEQLQREYPQTDGPWRFTTETLREDRYGNLRPALVALLIASVLLLSIACINVANLLLSRATARRREVALRRALGASAGRVAAQFLTESVMLALAGGTVGIAAAVALVRACASRLPGTLSRPGTLHPDWRVIGAASLVSLLTGLAFGLAPVLESRRVDLQAALKRGESRLGGSAGQTLRSALVGVQVGLSLVLLVGAVLLAESLSNLMQQPLGFQPEHVAVFAVNLPWNVKPERVRNFYDDVQQRIGSLPGVLYAGQIDAPPMTDWHLRSNYDADWLPQISGQPAMNAETRNIAGDLPAALGTPLLAGRSFTPEDQVAALPPVLVNQALVREFLPKGNPVGHHLLINGQAHEIVGVLANIRGTAGSIATEPGPEVYWPANANGVTHRYFVLRTQVAPEQLVDSIRRQVYLADPQQSIGGVETMDQLLDDAVAQPRLDMAVVASFAGIALILACVGIYGVVAYFVVQRTQEIGVRMALGATRGGIALLFVRRALTPALAGAVAGTAAALGMAQLLRSQLYGIRSTDARVYAASAAILLVPVTLATLRPALRAARVDPAQMLRSE
jgi:putative ABC transport system permease protein